MIQEWKILQIERECKARWNTHTTTWLGRTPAWFEGLIQMDCNSTSLSKKKKLSLDNLDLAPMFFMNRSTSRGRDVRLSSWSLAWARRRVHGRARSGVRQLARVTAPQSSVGKKRLIAREIGHKSIHTRVVPRMSLGAQSKSDKNHPSCVMRVRLNVFISLFSFISFIIIIYLSISVLFFFYVWSFYLSVLVFSFMFQLFFIVFTLVFRFFCQFQFKFVVAISVFLFPFQL
jgi:hypothetical protein